MPTKIEKPVEEKKEEVATPKKAPVKKVPAKTFAELYSQLSSPVPDEHKVSYTEDGKEFTGYNAQYAIDLLNETVGLENIEIKEEILKQEMLNKAWFVSMRVEVFLTYGRKTISRTGFGAAFSKRGANAYKGAKTSAFKNACRFYGIGKELFAEGFDEEISGQTVHQEATGQEETPAETPDKAETSETGGDAQDLIEKISAVESKSDLEDYRNTVIEFEAGEAVKKLLLKKFNDKLLSFDN